MEEVCVSQAKRKGPIVQAKLGPQDNIDEELAHWLHEEELAAEKTYKGQDVEILKVMAHLAGLLMQH